MLSKINMNKSIDKKEYKEKMNLLEKKLVALQQKLKEENIPVIITFEGWSASGKGTLIGKLAYPLDPRYFKVYTMDKVSEDAYMRPMLWSYWTKTPAKGQLAIFDKSWHRAAFPLGENKWRMPKKAKEGFFYDANAFEKQLTDDGTVIIKFFLHIDKEVQKQRFEELEKKPDTSWRVNKDDWKQNRDYDKYRKVFEDMLEKTDNAYSPWNIIEANDSRYAAVKVFEGIVGILENELLKRSAENSVSSSIVIPKTDETLAMLSKADLSKDISDSAYERKLQKLQKTISSQGYLLYTKRHSVVIVYEGWDAAGKGGNIKRLTQELDPRGYEVIPIGAPSKEDLSHHYLWRFWMNMPKDGHIGIFDRSWYGRVMVERVEKLCPDEDWQRAYKEINDMELHMRNHGVIILKFWLHIDKDEQLKRFNSRQTDPLKQYKITDEDWRNRDKWSLHEQAVNDMLAETSTSHAPWHIIESNCKKYARIKVLETVTKALEKELN